MKATSIVGLAYAVAMLACTAVPAAAQAPATDSVAGSAEECVESIEIAPGEVICARRLSLDVDAESGPAGESPSGTVLLTSLGLTPGGTVSVDADVTCLSVSGSVATIGVAGTRHQGGATAFDFWIEGLIRVVDAGGPASGADTIEFAFRTADISGPPLPGPTECSTFPAGFERDTFFFPDFNNATGDIVVTDAPALPTSKDQCKRGGWKRYGVFKNQGDCVSFVASHGP